MSQFGLSSAANSHWGYSTASAYPPYLASGSLPSCTTPTAAQFNNPALGFSCSPTENSSQDFTGARDCVPSKTQDRPLFRHIPNSNSPAVLPDSTATDLDQHLSNLVGTPPAQMSHQSLISGGGGGGTQGPITSSNPAANGILVPRYNQISSNNDYNLHSSQNGPRSLSDSSQAESPVQDDLLTSNTPNLGGNQNFSGLAGGVNQNQNSYGNGTNGCNGSIYPVLPASLLYTQLYTAANQTHGFHSHSLQTHSSQNSLMHGELQSVMDHIVTQGGGGNGVRHSHQQQQNLMAGNTDLGLIGNCGAAARTADENAAHNRQLSLNGPRGPPPIQPPGTENGNAVWRPY